LLKMKSQDQLVATQQFLPLAVALVGEQMARE
jgi:hypothetical protein